jgi:hypothetical protein
VKLPKIEVNIYSTHIDSAPSRSASKVIARWIIDRLRVGKFENNSKQD